MFDKLKNKEHLNILVKQFFRFISVGLINTLLCLSAIFVLKDIFHIHYMIANVIGYIIGVTFSFIFNKLWTFKSKTWSYREFATFVIIFFISFGVQFFVLFLLKEVLEIHVNLSIIIAMGFYTLINFSANKYITFRK